MQCAHFWIKLSLGGVRVVGLLKEVGFESDSLFIRYWAGLFLSVTFTV